MIPRHQEREFKLQLAARVKLQHERTGENMIDILLGIYTAFERQKMQTVILGQDGLFASEDAFYQFLYHHKEAVSQLKDEIAKNTQKPQIFDFDALFIDTGGEETARDMREMTSDAALKSADDEEFMTRTLGAFAQDLGHKLTDAVREKIRTYAKVIRAGKE